jgi:diacylglycerol kinase (ATP)
MRGMCLYHFLVNRNAGNGRGRSAWAQIQPLLEQQHVVYGVSYPENANDAVDHIRNLTPAVETLIVIGGDGSIQSVLTEIIAKQLPLGIIPAGSGNDVARALHLSFDAKTALVQILEGKPSPADVILHNGQYYATAIGVGFDGAIALAANQSWYKKLLNRMRMGRLTYVFALLQVLFRYQPADITLTLDDATVELSKVWLIALANFPSYGGGMNICPQANWDDGYLEVCVVQKVSRMELLRVFPKVYSGRHTSHPAIRMFRAKTVSITSERDLLAHGDGELAGTTPLTATLQPAKLTLVIPDVSQPS